MGSAMSSSVNHFELLKKQNAETSNAIIESFKNDETFLAFSKREAEGIIKR
jgi:hypothetical protein